ncbi:MAG: alpha-amylase family glycosyl hydrolase [Bacillota bacterium]|nr:alpha-amylase family glycosyl hydrolase [Bacillota bacterium]
MQNARTSPDFLKKSVIYQLFLRSFTPQGTLQAASRLLDHLAELGVDIVYLCPVALSDDDDRPEYWSKRQVASGLGNPQNPYRIKDFFAIDPEYGSDADLLFFVHKAHRLGLKVMLDLVYLHCGPKAVFIDEHPEFVKRTESGDVLYGPWNFPLMNFDASTLREYLWQNMEYFVQKFDVDGYRCDVGDGCPLDFWETGRQRLETIRPDIILLNEGTRPEYLLTAFDINYDFKWSSMLLKVFKGEAPATDLVAYWQELHEKLPAGGLSLKALDSHDIANDSYEQRIESVIGSKAVEAALLVNFTLDGIPFLYNGYEATDTNRHSIYGNRFYGKSLTVNWSQILTDTGISRLAFIRNLTALRHGQPALTSGSVQWLSHNAPGQVLAFTRKSAEQQLLIAINIRDLPLRVILEYAADSIGNNNFIVDRGADCTSGNGQLTIDLLPFGYCIMAV